ncbi:class I SAM-dependent RNA methyltransferase [Candidatus Saccharibacteria bacterium]|nr:class I SAM-dependent RNA methyltransferase [Candidatus Saccharibacteria bacterium]
MLKVEKLIPGGQALATLENGKKIFLWNALPGEEVVEYQTIKNKSSYTEGIATKIENPSQFRVEPKDVCYLSTSPWQILNYKQELIEKQNIIVEIFREHQITIDQPEILTDNKDYFYRNKMEYSLYWNHDTNQIELSFHARGSHLKSPIISSSIERPEILKKAKEIITELNNRGEEARKYQSLLLRCNQKGEVSGGLYENHKPHPTFPSLKDVIFGYEYSYSPNGFFQINLPVYELALQEIKKHINTDKVLDLYAGVGTIGLSVARNKNLTLVEVDKFAHSELVKNVTKEAEFENGNILAILSKSEEVLDYIEPDQTIILDPPRAGCDKKLIEKLNGTRPKTIIYLSCNPATQARDVKLLLENYSIINIKAFNFFPRTPHIENLIIMEKK